MKIAIFASEVVPFAKTGGLADVAGALPLALEKLKEEVIVIMPLYKQVREAGFKIQVLNEDLSTIRIGKDIKVYFIKNDNYFNRDGLYGTKEGDWPDNPERFSFFCKKALQILKEIKFDPQIIHCHDWQTSLIPVYLKTIYKDDEFYKNTKALLTIHNLGYQGLFPSEEFPKLGLDWSFFNMEALEFYGKVNILKGGIVFSDCINTVSPTYAYEIQTKEFGCGLEGLFAKRRDCLFGILNGLDYSVWNPRTDKFIAKTYDAKSLKAKFKNKEELQKISKLKQDKDVPLFGMVSRLAQQKGLDILTEALDEICKLNLQLIILGTGDAQYHTLLEQKSKKYPKKFRLYLKFDDPLAHKIYAGSDIFLMPSKYEPCGLGQMISFKYGTIPLAFKTGGLADTVNENNGLVFSQYSKEALVAKIKEAIALYGDKKKWQAKINRGMKANFSWQGSAKKYIELFTNIKRSTKG